jgi:hypothetical protein
MLFRDNNPEGVENNFQVVPETAFFSVFEIELDFLLHDDLDIVFLGVFSFFEEFILVAILDASGVSDAWSYIQHVHLLWCPVVDIVAHFWSWTYEAHIAYEHVDELG